VKKWVEGSNDTKKTKYRITQSCCRGVYIGGSAAFRRAGGLGCSRPVGDEPPAAAGVGPFYDNDNNGWAFIVDSPFFVDGLSAYDIGADGFGGDMLVTLWDHASATLLASAVVPAAGDGSIFPTVSISPIALSAGVEYSVAAGRADFAQERWDRWPNSSITFNAPVSGARQVYGSQAGVFPGWNGFPRDGYTTAGGNFTYNVISESVPCVNMIFIHSYVTHLLCLFKILMATFRPLPNDPLSRRLCTSGFA